jgi:hypothetical protein
VTGPTLDAYWNGRLIISNTNPCDVRSPISSSPICLAKVLKKERGDVRRVNALVSGRNFSSA